MAPPSRKNREGPPVRFPWPLGGGILRFPLGGPRGKGAAPDQKPGGTILKLCPTIMSAAVFALALAPARLPSAEEGKVKLLIITGSHGHDWVNTLPILKEFLSKTGRIEVE